MIRINKTINEGANFPPTNTVAGESHERGMRHNEPLMQGLCDAVRFAEAYEKRYGSKIAPDYVLAEHYKGWIDGLRGLLCGMGAVAMEQDISTDTKDDGFCESVYWLAMKAGGFEDETQGE